MLSKDDLKLMSSILQGAKYYIENGNTLEASENIDSILLWLDTEIGEVQKC